VIVVLERGSSEAQVAAVVAELERRGLSVRVVNGSEKPLIHVLEGPTRSVRAVLKMEAVQGLIPTSGPRVRREGRRFYPYHFIGWSAAALIALGVLVVLAGFFPPGLGAEVDVIAPPSESTFPWYLRLPASGLARLPGWLATLLVAGLAGLALLLPILDRGKARRRASALLLAASASLAWLGRTLP
jgi:hypothetical protein